jgi:hypothetical protein
VIGPHLWLWLLVAGAALATAVWAGSRTWQSAAAGGLGVFLFAHVITSVTSYKAVFLGMAVPGFLFLSGIAMAGYTIRVLSAKAGAGRLLAVAFCTVLVIGGLGFFRFPEMRSILAHVYTAYPTSGVAFIKEAESRRSLVQTVLETMRSDPRPTLTAGIEGGTLYSTPFVYQYQANKDRTRELRFVDLPGLQSPSEMQRTLETLDYVIFGVRDGSDDRSRLQEMLEDTWQQAARVPMPADKVEHDVFRRGTDWRKIRLDSERLDGFGGMEGPYPPNTFKVRWAFGPSLLYSFTTSKPENLELQMEAITSLPDQRMTVLVNRNQVAALPLPISDKFQVFRIPLPLNPGQQVLEIQFSTYDKTPGARPLAVLFRKFELAGKTD